MASSTGHPRGTQTLPRAAPRRIATGLGILAGAVLLRLIAGVGFVNYDTLYALVWGQQLSRMQTPQYAIPIAPTPHPLIEALGVVLAPLGPGTTRQITVWLGFVALAGCAYALYRLGAWWFGQAAGILAALILITRMEVLSYGVRAYVDIPYLLFLLAVLVESRRPRAGAPCWCCLPSRGCCDPKRGSSPVFTGSIWWWTHAVAFQIEPVQPAA